MTQKDTSMCKGIAIIMMYIHHLFYSTETFKGQNVIFTFLTGEQVITVAQIFKVCVSIFVFLTGYGYAKSELIASKKYEVSYKTLTCKRVLRLMFGYWFIFILALLTSFLRETVGVYSEELGVKIFELFIDASGLAFAFASPTLNATWWYVSYAIFLVFVTPYLIRVVRYCKGSILPITILILCFLPKDIAYNTIFRYAFPLILGIYFAEFNLFEKIGNMFSRKHNYDFLIVIFLCIYLSFIRQRIEFYQIIDGILAMLTCYFTYLFVKRIPIIRNILEYLGRHSMNMFLIHTFIYLYYFKNFIYSFKYDVLILIVLLVITVGLSEVIERIKGIIGYKKIENLIIEKVI